MIDDINYEEVKKTARLAIGKLDPSLPFGTDLFNELLKITVGVAVEAVIIRDFLKESQVFLTQRKKGETCEGQWHCPGTFIRHGEETEKVFQRLFLNESLGTFSKITFMGVDNNLKEERGHVTHLIYKVEASPNLETGCWFPVLKLPKNIVKHHREVVIPTAVK